MKIFIVWYNFDISIVFYVTVYYTQGNDKAPG